MIDFPLLVMILTTIVSLLFMILTDKGNNENEE
jgi:hypothetical protein